MVERIDALVLSTARLQQTGAFYRALGVPLEEERHEEGPLHWACDLGGAHFAIYETAEPGDAPGRGLGGSTLFGLRVASLEDAFAAAAAAGGTVLVPPQDVPWGRRAVVADPDGRPVELNQAPQATDP